MWLAALHPLSWSGCPPELQLPDAEAHCNDRHQTPSAAAPLAKPKAAAGSVELAPGWPGPAVLGALLLSPALPPAPLLAGEVERGCRRRARSPPPAVQRHIGLHDMHDGLCRSLARRPVGVAGLPSLRSLTYQAFHSLPHSKTTPLRFEVISISLDRVCAGSNSKRLDTLTAAPTS